MKNLYFLAAAGTIAALLCACSAARTGGAQVPEETAEDAIVETAAALPAQLDIYGFSAGKADAFLLSTENSAVLIDAGEKGFGKTILARLEELGVDRLDYLIITHFDQDHVGGAAKVLNNIEVGTVLQTNRSKDSSEYEKYVKALRNASLEPVTVRETYEFTLDGVRYSVDPPRKSKYNADSSNNSSLIISVYNGEDSFLFAGDAQTERIEEFLEWNESTYDVLKVPHHGKEEPLMAELIASVSPSYAVITSSDEDPESAETVALLEAAGAEIYLTRTAPVEIHSGGTGITAGYGTASAVIADADDDA